ncbi:MAG: transglutaminase family protein [Rhodobacterales bacterium]|nr:transglutaminase family protein [Rhodobacterales bacterium]
MTEDLAPFLRPGRFVDSDHPDVVAFAHQHAAGTATDRDRVVALYYAVRDQVRYDPYVPYAEADTYRASAMIRRGRGFCIPKAALLAAVCRVVGLPARVGYADVRNHLSTPRLSRMVGGDVYCWHGYTETWVDGAWVKSTPAFNAAMCEKFGVHPLEFDGREDSLLHPYDTSGRQHMEYLKERGTFADVPYDTIIADFRRVHAGMFDDAATAEHPDFADEGAAARERS